jgi:predicted flap endonuclease-1-like 5' DNA nuclease
MLFLLQSLFPWIAAALALGLTFGLLACGAGQRPPRRRGWIGLLVLAFLAGAGAAALQIAPGRWGFQIETALAIFGAYGLGGLCGYGLRRLFRERTAAPAPDWIAAAQDFLHQAEGFAAAAPRALSALAAASGLLASSESKSSAQAPSPPNSDLGEEQAIKAAPPETEGARLGPSQPELDSPERRESEFACDQDDLALIHGLGRAEARGLRGQGIADLAGLARMTGEDQAAMAIRLGRGRAVVAYWAAQARLLAHGVETDYARERSAHAGANARDSRERSAHAGANARDSRERSAHAAFREDISGGGGTPEPLDEGTAQFLSAALPQVVAPQANDRLYPGERPLGLLAPPHGEGDDIQRMAGVGVVTAKRLNQLGIWTFRQIAAWSQDNERWVDSYLASPGRVAREQWREQAATLAGLTRESSEC